MERLLDSCLAARSGNSGTPPQTGQIDVLGVFAPQALRICSHVVTFADVRFLCLTCDHIGWVVVVVVVVADGACWMTMENKVSQS